jgi:hypothetical protein
MPEPRRTRIEMLGKKVQQFVDLRLDGNQRRECRVVDISKELKLKFGVDVPRTTIENYKNRRWAPLVYELRVLQQLLRFILKQLGVDALSESAQGRILQALHEAFRRGVKLNPEFLLREQRLWAEHNLRKRALENTARRMERANRERIRARGRERGEIGKAVSDEKADPAEIRRRIREIYGIYEPVAPESPPFQGAKPGAGDGSEGDGSSSAVPGPVGEG